MVNKVDILTTMRNYRSDMGNITSEYYNKSEQLTSGQKYKLYSDLTNVGKTNFKINNDSTIKHLKSLEVTNLMEYKEMDIIHKQISYLYKLNEEMARQIIERKTPIGHLRNLSSLTKMNLANIKAVLETKFSGKPIFFGSNTIDTNIGDIVNKSNIVNGEITANYSVGDEYRKTIKYSIDSPQMEYGILDHDSAFQKMIAYHHYILDFENTNDKNTLDKAFLLYSETRDELSNMMSDLSSKMKQIEDINNNNTETRLKLEEALQTELSNDPAQLVAEIQQLQYTLNASYKVFSMMQKTNLAEYL